MIFIEYPILVFIALGFLIRFIPQSMKSVIKTLAVAGALFSLFYGVYGFVWPLTNGFSTLFQYRIFPGLIGLGCAFFGFIVVIFSLRYADYIEHQNKYYSYIFFSIGFSLAAVYSTNLLGLLIFWGLQGLTLYLLSNLLPGASNASKKSYVFIGGSDVIMILGMAIMWATTNSLNIYGIKIPLGSSAAATVSFICLAIGALTKAGAMPFHSWVPDFAQDVPITLTAFFPASLDKLLGIFLLVLICNQLFVLNAAMTFVLLAVGAVTIISAVSMALIQHDLKKLLSYHAVSQVGYMVLGIATGTPLGIAAGLFHLINHALYKSGLFLVASSVENRTGKTNMDYLGGLAKVMPYTFIICVICSFSISGVPLFNGFASKWMIYLSLIQKLGSSPAGSFMQYSYIVFIVLAMFGSALTLASFIKVIHSVFLGQFSENSEDVKRKYTDVPLTMKIPMGILALLCVAFGVFPNIFPLKLLVFPALSSYSINFVAVPGLWRPDLAALFVIIGLALGLIIYLLSKFKFRKDNTFVGGEEPALEAEFPGTQFYNTISEAKYLKRIFVNAENKVFDIYHQGQKAASKGGEILSSFHTGSLQFYLIMLLIGLVAIAVAYLAGGQI